MVTFQYGDTLAPLNELRVTIGSVGSVHIDHPRTIIQQ